LPLIFTLYPKGERCTGVVLGGQVIIFLMVPYRISIQYQFNMKTLAHFGSNYLSKNHGTGNWGPKFLVKTVRLDFIILEILPYIQYLWYFSLSTFECIMQCNPFDGKRNVHILVLQFKRVFYGNMNSHLSQMSHCLLTFKWIFKVGMNT